MVEGAGGSENPKPGRDWKAIEDEVRAAWQTKAESQAVKADPFAAKEVRLRSRTRLWIVRGAIIALALVLIVGGVWTLTQSGGGEVTRTWPTPEAGPPMRLLPTPPVVVPVVETPTPEPTLRPEDYRVFPATPPR